MPGHTKPLSDGARRALFLALALSITIFFALAAAGQVDKLMDVAADRRRGSDSAVLRLKHGWQTVLGRERDSTHSPRNYCACGDRDTEALQEHS